MADSKSRKVTNETDRALGLPSGEVIPAGETRNVKDWTLSENNDVVKSWIDAKALTVGAAKAAPSPEGEGDDGKKEGGEGKEAKKQPSK